MKRIRKLKRKKNAKYCECGCGQEVRLSHHRFIHGHNQHNKNISEEHKRKIGLANSNLTDETKLKLYLANIGKKLSNETKLKLRLINLGKKHSDETKLKLSKLRKGIKCSEETRKRMSLAQQNKSEETKRKIGLASKGRKHTEEAKRKLSKINIGKEISKEIREKISKANKGKIRSEEFKIKISCFAQGVSKEEWKGFIYQNPYCQEFTEDLKNFIKGRDNYECQNPNCWKTSEKLSVHHIDYIKKNCVLNNLITLCISCNARANYNRNYWEKFYTNLLIERRICYGER